MGIIRMSLLTAGVMGAAMMHFGRDDGLPTDRIGREPTVAQDTIVPVSAKVQETDASAVIPVAAVIPEVAAPAVPQVVVVKAAATFEDDSPAALAEAAARKMAASAPAPAEPAFSGDLSSPFPTMFVSGSTVNMRGGPSTQHGVVTKLTRGTEVLETGQTDDGWSQIKVVGTGKRGFIASRFLKPQL